MQKSAGSYNIICGSIPSGTIPHPTPLPIEQSPGQVQPLVPGGGELFNSCTGGVGGGIHNKNYFVYSFFVRNGMAKHRWLDIKRFFGGRLIEIGWNKTITPALLRVVPFAQWTLEKRYALDKTTTFAVVRQTYCHSFLYTYRHSWGRLESWRRGNRPPNNWKKMSNPSGYARGDDNRWNGDWWVARRMWHNVTLKRAELTKSENASVRTSFTGELICLFLLILVDKSWKKLLKDRWRFEKEILQQVAHPLADIHRGISVNNCWSSNLPDNLPEDCFWFLYFKHTVTLTLQ